MKKWIGKRKIMALTAIMLCISVFLCGCVEDMFTTSSYRQCKSFSERFAKGGVDYNKQAVYHKLGRPDGYVTKEGGYSSSYRDEVERLYDEDVYRWVYDGYEMPDPANPFRMTVTFDETGKCIDVVFKMVEGG